MRLVADTPDDYQKLSRIQKQITQMFKNEKENNPGGILFLTYKSFINTSIEKSYERPGESTAVANTKAVADTDDKNLFIPYIVQAAIKRNKVAIEYMDAKGNVSKRVIEPHTWRNDQVVAWCHERGAWRQFKPKQIQRVAIIDETFDRTEDVEITADHAKEYAHLVN